MRRGLLGCPRWPPGREALPGWGRRGASLPSLPTGPSPILHFPATNPLMDREPGGRAWLAHYPQPGFRRPPSGWGGGPACIYTQAPFVASQREPGIGFLKGPGPGLLGDTAVGRRKNTARHPCWHRKAQEGLRGLGQRALRRPPSTRARRGQPPWPEGLQVGSR